MGLVVEWESGGRDNLLPPLAISSFGLFVGRGNGRRGVVGGIFLFIFYFPKFLFSKFGSSGDPEREDNTPGQKKTRNSPSVYLYFIIFNGAHTQ